MHANSSNAKSMASVYSMHSNFLTRYTMIKNSYNVMLK